MKTPSVMVTVIASVALVICTGMISSAITSFGRSLERAAGARKPASINLPSNIRIGFEGGNSPIRIDLEETTGK